MSESIKSLENKIKINSEHHEETVAKLKININNLNVNLKNFQKFN